MNESWLTITEKAAAKLREIALAENNQTSSVRVAVVRTHCMGGKGFNNKLEFDTPTADDKVLENNGIQLCVDEASGAYLKGAHIDYVESSGKKGFTIDNPNVRAKCPCGRHDIFE